jgi:hypothetical protein
MRILVESHDEKTINLIFPTVMIFNRLTAAIGSSAIRQHLGTDLSEFKSADINRLFREIRRVKRKYPHLELVSVDSADGDKVRITL